jgi:hypothetical protein
VRRFPEGRLWQASLFTEGVWDGQDDDPAFTLKPGNIALALTRITLQGGAAK